MREQSFTSHTIERRAFRGNELTLVLTTTHTTIKIGLNTKELTPEQTNWLLVKEKNMQKRNKISKHMPKSIRSGRTAHHYTHV